MSKLLPKKRMKCVLNKKKRSHFNLSTIQTSRGPVEQYNENIKYTAAQIRKIYQKI